MRAHACVCAIGMRGRGSDSLKDKRDSGKEFYNNNAACPVMLYNKKKHEFFLSKKKTKKPYLNLWLLHSKNQCLIVK